MTTVINLRGRRGLNEDEAKGLYVYIGRPSKWGNPFVIDRDGTREQVIQRYEEYIKARPELMNALYELKGKKLGCWCAPAPCHGDVLARLADALP